MDIDNLNRQKQKNVQEQNALRKDRIVHLTCKYIQSPADFHWLRSTLKSRGHDALSGVLVNLDSIPEQEGDLFKGLWLTDDQRFIEFEVMLSRHDHSVLDVEAWADITDIMTVTAHAPGTGKSDGFLALEVLREKGGS